MKKANKYSYLVILQGDYGFGHGFEDLTAFEGPQKWRDALRCKREYLANDSYAKQFRLIERREINE